MVSKWPGVTSSKADQGCRGLLGSVCSPSAKDGGPRGRRRTHRFEDTEAAHDSGKQFLAAFDGVAEKKLLAHDRRHKRRAPRSKFI